MLSAEEGAEQATVLMATLPWTCPGHFSASVLCCFSVYSPHWHTVLLLDPLHKLVAVPLAPHTSTLARLRTLPLPVNRELDCVLSAGFCWFHLLLQGLEDTIQTPVPLV